VAHASFILPRPVLGVLRLNTGYDGVGVCAAAAAAVVGAAEGGAGGGLDGVAGAAVGGDVAVAFEDFFGGYVAGVVEEGGVVEDGLEVFWDLGGGLLVRGFFEGGFGRKRRGEESR
jgi:hypothetical protein